MPRGVPASGVNAGWFRRGVSTPKSAEHKQCIGEAQRRAWRTTRQRMPIGSKWTDTQGYVRVKVTDGSGKWRLEHAIVVEKSINRPLRKGEVIHHIDGDRQNNAPSNLFLCRDRSHHNRVHNSQDAALRTLLAAGVVVFLDGVYEAVL